MNEYSSVGSILKPLVDFCLIPYYRDDGLVVMPQRSRIEDVNYPKDVLFGNLSANEVPKHCEPYGGGYGTPWRLIVSNGEAMSIKDMEEHDKKVEFKEKIAFETAYKMWLNKMKSSNLSA